MNLFKKTYILGGSPCSGKSTAAQRLCAEFGFQAYEVDALERVHFDRSEPAKHPTMFKLSNMNGNDIWSRPVHQQVEDELNFYRERFEFILDDLKQYDPEKPMVLEGAAYIPELLEPIGFNPQRILYMIPTKAFQVKHYSQRPWIHSILQECDNPKQAFVNWMERDHLFGQEVQHQAKTFSFKVITVDDRLHADAIYKQVLQHFGLV